MRLMNKMQKSIILTIAFLMLFSLVPGFAQAEGFKDVPKSNWAYEYVKKATDLGYFKGTSEDKFSPGGTLNFDQAIVLLGRFTNPTANEKTMAKNTYGGFLNDLNVVDWAREDMAVALHKNVVSKDEIKNAYDNKRGDKPISKLATSMFLVRSMGLTEDAESKNMVSLTYRDALSMSTLEMKYLAVLIEADVLDPKGSGTGLFEPQSSLRRDVMAKMMTTANDYLEKNPDKPKEPSKPIEKDEVEATEKITGIIVSPISNVGTKRFIIIDDGKGKQDAYELLSNTSITLDGKAATTLELSEGQEIELIIKKGTRETISIKALSIDKDISGIIKNVASSTSKLTVEYIVDKTTVSSEHTVDKDAYIHLDGKTAKLNDLSKDDKVKVKIKNGVIYDIEAEAKERRVEGIITELVAVKDSRDKEYNITIKVPDTKDSKDKSYSFLINEDTLIYKDNRRTYEVTDLKINDEAYIKAEYGVALEVDAKIVKRNVKGIIKGMNTRLHEKLEITVLDRETKEEETYVLGKTPYIRVDGIITNTFDLKVGYFVDLRIEGDEIVEIDADSRASEVAIMGTVLRIGPREMIITIESFNLDLEQYGDEMTVYLKDGVDIRGLNYNVILPSEIRRGDRVTVVGSYDGSTLVANTIQLR